MHKIQQDAIIEEQAAKQDNHGAEAVTEQPVEAKLAESAGRPSAATQAIELAHKLATFGVDPNQQAWAFMHGKSGTEVCLVGSQQFADSLSYRFYSEHKKALSSNACTEAISVLQATARFEGASTAVHLRSSYTAGENRLVLDLADPGDQVVTVDSAGWKISSRHSCGVHFHRPQGVLPLPIPEVNATGGLERLAKYISLEDKGQLSMLAISMAFMLVGRGPFPVVILQGDPGSGKSEAARRIRAVIDPSTVPLQSLFTSERDAVIACTNSKIIALDNMREIKPIVSDVICRIATGGGLRLRRLRTDQDEQLFNIMAPVILTGIEDMTTQPDLADRSMVFTCQRIGATERRSQQQLESDFSQDAPYILGTLLDIIVGAWRELPRLSMTELPRMADFALFGIAAAKHLGLPAGKFLEMFKTAQRAAISGIRAQDPVLEALIEQYGESTGEWRGTTALLLQELNKQVSKTVTASKTWPRNAQSLGKRLSAIRPSLEAHDIYFEVFNSGGRKLRIWSSSSEEAPAPEKVETNDNQESDTTAVTNKARMSPISAFRAQLH